jgi:hypothetical protein
LAKDKHLLTEAVDALDKLFEAASRGRFDLSSSSWLNAAEAAGPIGKASGMRVTRIHFVPADATELKEPAFTVEESVRVMNGFRPGEALWWAIWTPNRYAWSTGLEKRLGAHRKQAVGDSLMANLGRGLDAALMSTLNRGGKKLFRRFHACLFNSIWDCVQYAVGHAIVGDKARVDNLLPLVKSLNRYIPFSSKTDEPAAWICISG